MKANFFKIFIVAAALPIVSSLISCSEDVADNNRGESLNSTTTNFFSEGDGMTRTSINNKRAFFWEDGDKIFVKKGGEWIESSPVSLTEKASSAKFVISGSFTDTNYPVAYTGTNATSAAEVTIADQQTQKAWNDGSHLGSSGDCGVANAIRLENGKYKFTLDHKASYLLIYPFLNTDLTGDYTLEKIEVYSDLSATNIAGTFDFDFTNGLLNSDGTPKTPDAGTGKQEMTLNCGNLATGEFGLPKTAPNLSDANNAAPHCLMVIAPGDHQLTIRYVTKKSDGTQYEFIKDIALKQYKPNGVYTFVHEMKDAEVDFGFEFNEVNTFYRWGRTYESYGTESSDYDTQTSSVTTGFWAIVPDRDIYNYLSEDVYYDNSAKWKFNRRNGTQEIRRGGWWLRKKAYLTPGASEPSRPTIQGRPNKTVIDQYFFLPTLNPYIMNGESRQIGLYWTRIAAINSNETIAMSSFSLLLEATQVSVPIYRRWVEMVAGTRPDGTPWFQ